MDSANSKLASVPTAAASIDITGEPAAVETDASAQVTRREKEMLAQRAAAGSVSRPDAAGRKVNREHLVNRLNFLNFQEEPLQVVFTHGQYNRSLVAAATPHPCMGEILALNWTGERDLAGTIHAYHLDHILVPRGPKQIKAFVEVLHIDERGALLRLPEVSYESSHRRIERQSCSGISTQVFQNSATFSGRLQDFNSSSFRVDLEAKPPQTFEWIDPARPVHVIFFAKDQTYYSGDCRVVRQTENGAARSFVLEPLKHEVQRYRRAEYRSQRQKLTPSPNIVFRHPLTRKRVDLKVVDLSGTGFSVEEHADAAVLLPGLVLPQVELRFANGFSITCSAQVVFRKAAAEQRRPCIRCGLAMIDVSARDHITLLGMLHQVKDGNSYVCNDLDPEALWDFFFETGFIYPAKYALIEKNKKEIRETYGRLYTLSPDIARHFVYQDNGVILGHMATIRFWENAWLIHHHAARKSALNRAGLIVLDQIGRFGHDSFRIRGMHMDYLICYYRPDNRFPSRVFGGVARHINNPRGCSVDPLAFLKPLARETASRLPPGWQLDSAGTADLEDLAFFYDRASGGLMLKALDLEPETWREEALCREFSRHGFRRERRLLALRSGAHLKALLIVSVSDIGLNLSDLTHCVTALVLEPEGLSRTVFLSALQTAVADAGQPNMPILVFPASYAEAAAIPFEKIYNLWVFHMHSQSQAYFKYLSRLMKYV